MRLCSLLNSLKFIVICAENLSGFDYNELSLVTLNQFILMIEVVAKLFFESLDITLSIRGNIWQAKFAQP